MREITQEIINELGDLAYKDGTETGDLANGLIDLWEGGGRYGSDSFIKALEKEILECRENMKKWQAEDEEDADQAVLKFGQRIQIEVGINAFRWTFQTKNVVKNEKDLIPILKEAIAILEAPNLADLDLM